MKKDKTKDAEEKRLDEYWANVKEKKLVSSYWCGCKTRQPGSRRYVADPNCPDCVGAGRMKSYRPFCDKCKDSFGFIRNYNTYKQELCECQKKMQAEAWGRERQRKVSKRVAIDHDKTTDAVLLYLHVERGGHYVAPRRKIITPQRKVER